MELKEVNKYQRGKIYKIISDEANLTYIGSSCEKYLSNRLAHHKTNYKRYFDGKKEKYTSSYEVLKYPDCKIILIENYPCNDKYELEARERYYIENNECVNIIIPTRSCEEYLESTKEYQVERRKEYYKNNREKQLERSRKYKEENKDKVDEYKEKNRDKMNEYAKQYRSDNKEKISQYHKDHYKEIKEKRNQRVICECGIEISKGALNTHKKSKSHIDKIATGQPLLNSIKLL